MRWFIADIGRNPKLAWLMNGSQFFGTPVLTEVVESDYPAEFSHVTTQLARIPAPVAFASGDVHFYEINRIDPSILGYETREYTSSLIHSLSFGPVDLITPTRLALTRRHNFMVFDVETTDGWDINCRSVVENNGVAFQESVLIGR